jgi:hypothetical protein
VAFKKVIFPLWTLKSVKNMFVMDRDQRMIIKFLWNEGAGACQIAARLQTQFVEHVYQFQTVQFWITEI